MYLRTLFTQITKIRFCPHQLQNRKVPHFRKVHKSNKLFKSAYLRICETYLRNCLVICHITCSSVTKLANVMNVIFLFFIRKYIFLRKRITMKIGKWGDIEIFKDYFPSLQRTYTSNTAISWNDMELNIFCLERVMIRHGLYVVITLRILAWGIVETKSYLLV